MGVGVGTIMAPGALPPVASRVFGLAEQARMIARFRLLLERFAFGLGQNLYHQGHGLREHP